MVQYITILNTSLHWLWQYFTFQKTPHTPISQGSYGVPHDGITKWKCFLCYWSFVRGIHWSPVDSSHKGSVTELWCLFFMLHWANRWKKKQLSSWRFEMPRHSYDVIVMLMWIFKKNWLWYNSSALYKIQSYHILSCVIGSVYWYSSQWFYSCWYNCMISLQQ